jgi:hypothetical protein
VWVAGRAAPEGTCRAQDASGELIAVAELTGTLLRPIKVMAG